MGVIGQMVKALFPMKRYKGINYNIYAVDLIGNPVDYRAIERISFQAWVFDQNRRIWYKSYCLPTIHAAVLAARDIIVNLNKGAVPHGIRVDEGKGIRDREEAEHIEAQRLIRKQKREAKRG